jgi:formylglycine-generating enzyme required for sulfatase activity
VRRWLCTLAPVAALGVLVACGRSGFQGTTSVTSGTTESPGQETPDTPEEIITKSGIQMVYLPGGEFTMGSARGDPDEAPPHRVKLTSFLMDKFEVTHAMFVQAQLPDPSHWQDQTNKPVERVRWRDAKQYCNERSLLEGLPPCYNERTAAWECNYDALGYRLPTEAEWEYAARAGTDRDYDFGPVTHLKQYSWFEENSGMRTHPVGQKKPNRWGLYDLYGNVSEWCEDIYAADYYAHSPAVDPAGPPNPGKDVKRVLRGGSWKASADMCRVDFRQGQRTGDTDACFYTDYCGFRCVRRISTADFERLRGLPP